MSSRESINRGRVEGWALSRVPIDSTETIYQGDALIWNDSVHQATKAGSASGSQFIGISDTKNPVETAGSPTFLSDTANPRVKVIQQGLVEVIWDANETIYPFNTVVLGTTSAQHFKKGSSNPVGIVDPAIGAAGKLVAVGDLVKIWLRVPDAYRVFF